MFFGVALFPSSTWRISRWGRVANASCSTRFMLSRSTFTCARRLLLVSATRSTNSLGALETGASPGPATAARHRHETQPRRGGSKRAIELRRDARFMLLSWRQNGSVSYLKSYSDSVVGCCQDSSRLLSEEEVRS